MAANNVHENVRRVQGGGTALLAFGTLIEQYDYDDSKSDDLGLGRWLVMKFSGADNRAPTVLCGYNPCYTAKTGSRTSYHQHK